jgi:hypothetical protein
MMAKLRELLLAEMVPLEENDFARGVNQGLREALRIVEGHDCAASIKAALDVLRTRGMKTGGDLPYGYRRSDDGKTLIEDESEQEVIAIVKRLRKAGKKLREIADALRKKGKRSRDRGPFDPKQISRMLRPPRAGVKAKATSSQEVPQVMCLFNDSPSKERRAKCS